MEAECRGAAAPRDMGGPNGPARDAGQRRQPGGNGPGSRPGHHQATESQARSDAQRMDWALPPAARRPLGGAPPACRPRRYQSRNGAIDQDPPVANRANGSSEFGAVEDRNKITNIGNERSRWSHRRGALTPRLGGREGAPAWGAAWTASPTSCAVSASMTMFRRSSTRRTICPACRGHVARADGGGEGPVASGSVTPGTVEETVVIPTHRAWPPQHPRSHCPAGGERIVHPAAR